MTDADVTRPDGFQDVVAPALFVPADGPGGRPAWLPTDASRGPWDPNACHGGAPAAFITRALEQVPLPESSDGEPVPMRLARVTIELVRPVPTRPLLVDTEVVRPGRKVGLVEATLRSADDGAVVAMARALRIRVTGPGDVQMHDAGPGGPSEHQVDDLPPALPAAPSDVRLPHMDYPGFHNAATEHRFVRGAFSRPGPAFDWIRLRVPVVPDEEPSPWQRAAAAADFANGIATSVAFDGSSLFINPDLTVHLWREPVGEWVGLESVMRTSDTGVGLSDSALWDLHGRIGRGNQSLLLDHL